jgi:enoyl-CoA hydratase
MSKVLFEKDGHIARISLNRPEKLNAIDDEVPVLLQDAVLEAEKDTSVHVIILSGNGKAFCGGYDLAAYAENKGPNNVYQGKNWDPLTDYNFMWGNTQKFMSLWRCPKPVLCKIHGFAVGGGSDIALCSDMIFMAENARIGYMSTRVWGCPSTAMWVYRVGAERAKRILFTGDQITGIEASAMGLVLKAIPEEALDNEIEAMASRLASVPINQLAMQKMVINQAVEATGLSGTQQLATLLDGISRHTPEGHNFKNRVEVKGWKQAVLERDEGTFDWSRNKPIQD